MLEIKSLNKKFNTFELKNVSFELKPGYIMGFIGPNGAGKSTVIKLIMNLLKKDSGEIKIFDKDNVKNEKQIKDRIGFVYDESYFYEDLSLKQMKKIIAPFYSKWSDETFCNYIAKFNLDEKMKIKNLSKGMKMKYSLALALSHDADLIIMDEPTSGLDPIFRREMLDILYDIIQDENKSVFFSTHITTDLEKIADYITFIDDGEVVFSKSKEEILEEYKLIKGNGELIDSDIKKEFIGIRVTDVGFEALSNDVKKIQKLFGDQIIIEKATLEDIMYFTIKGEQYA